eukprot:663971-Alexandrium_andersonii.AAC.1
MAAGESAASGGAYDAVNAALAAGAMSNKKGFDSMACLSGAVNKGIGPIWGATLLAHALAIRIIEHR